MKYRTIYFDLDGTLTDPGLGITNSVIYALTRMGRTVPPRQALYRYIGPPLWDSFRRYEAMTQEESSQAVAWFREYFQERGKFENQVYPGVPDMLGRLRERGDTLVLATSKPEPFAVEILEHYDLDRFFSFVAGGTMDDKRSAKGDVLAYALSAGGRGGAVMVGDRKHDVQGARENGIPCIGVLFGYGSRRELEEAGADGIAATVPELTEILLGE